MKNKLSTIISMIVFAAILITIAFTCTSAPVETSAAMDVFSNYILMDNGDYVLEDYGSVSYDLNKLDLELTNYKLGIEPSTFITYQESDTEAFLYVYSKDKYLEYDTLSMAHYEGNLSQFTEFMNYKEYDVTLVSFDSSYRIHKYLINDHVVDNTFSHLVRIRQLYNHENRTDLDFIFEIGITYQYNAATDSNKIDREETIRVTDKIVGHSLYTQNPDGLENVFQRSFVAFDLDQDVEEIVSIKYKFEGYEYAGMSNIELDYYANSMSGGAGHRGFAEALANQHLVMEMDHSQFFEYGDIYSDDLSNNVFVKDNEEFNLTYESGYLWGHKQNEWIYDSIMKVDELTQEDLQFTNVDVTDYEHLFSFDNRSFDCTFFAYINNSITNYSIRSIGNIAVGMYSHQGSTTNKWNYADISKLVDNGTVTASFDDWVTTDIIKNHMYVSELKPLHVEDFSFLEFTLYQEGEVVEKVAIDTYTDSQGGIQIGAPGPEEPENIFDTIKEIVMWALIAIGAIIVLWIIGLIIKLIKWIVK